MRGELSCRMLELDVYLYYFEGKNKGRGKEGREERREGRNDAGKEGGPLMS